MIKNIKWLAIAALVIASCAKEDEVTVANPDSSDGLPLTAGSANFSKYVALGNSLTAGFSDNALFIEGQKGSWTNLLAQKFKLVGGGDFKIPLMSDNVGGIAGVPGFTPRLFFNGSGPVSLALPPYNQVSTTPLLPALVGPFNNMGVPGAKSFHLLAPGYGNAANLPNANPYFVRFASTPGASILGDAMAQNPTFFSLWIGNNDVLGYATTGGDDTNPITPIAGAAGVGFDATYDAIVNTLTANPVTKGIVSNIPYVTSVPYFTTVPTDPFPGLPSANVTSLNQLFGGINAALAASGLPPRFVTLVADDGNPATIEKNPLLIVDDNPSPMYPNISTQITAALTPIYGAGAASFLGTLYGKARHARNTTGNRDYILLPTRGLITPPNNVQSGLPIGLEAFSIRGISYPLQDSAVLTAYETGLVKTATDAYNSKISAVASAKGLAFVDANAILSQVATTSGISANGFTVKSDYITGGGFSTDGVHPSPRGYALIANKALEAINAKYGSNLGSYDLGMYRILFPSTL